MMVLFVFVQLLEKLYKLKSSSSGNQRYPWRRSTQDVVVDLQKIQIPIVSGSSLRSNTHYSKHNHRIPIISFLSVLREKGEVPEPEAD